MEPTGPSLGACLGACLGAYLGAILGGAPLVRGALGAPPPLWNPSWSKPRARPIRAAVMKVLILLDTLLLDKISFLSIK